MSTAELTDGLLTRLQTTDHALNASEVAKLLNVGKSTIHRLCDAREIPFFKVGNLTRFVPALIARWLIERQAIVSVKKMLKAEEREARRR
jgi:excisionase family DNA binding protein